MLPNPVYTKIPSIKFLERTGCKAMRYSAAKWSLLNESSIVDIISSPGRAELRTFRGRRNCDSATLLEMRVGLLVVPFQEILQRGFMNRSVLYTWVASRRSHFLEYLSNQVRFRAPFTAFVVMRDQRFSKAGFSLLVRLREESSPFLRSFSSSQRSCSREVTQMLVSDGHGRLPLGLEGCGSIPRLNSRDFSSLIMRNPLTSN